MADVQIAVIDQQDTQIALAVPGVQGPGGATGPTGPAGIPVVASGTVAAPAISFVSDPDTGINNNGPNQLALVTGGQNALLVDASGVTAVGGDLTLSDGGTYTTTLQTITPTVARTISFPDATGTVALVAGSSGQLVYNNAGAQAGVPGSTVGATGQIGLNDGTSAAPIVKLGTSQTGFYTRASSARVNFAVGGSDSGVEVGPNILALASSGQLAWVSSTLSNSAPDVYVSRDGDGILAQRNGATAQAFRVYNTFASSTNYELGKLQWSGNVFRIGTEKGSGGGTARTVEVHTDSIARLALDTTGSVRVVTGLTVATLPGTPAVGMIARVTDASAPAMGAIVAGGGAAAALVWYNGTNWRVIGV